MRITPTQWARHGGEPVRQLGSTQAVVDALPDGGALVIGQYQDRKDINLRGRELTIITATAGEEPLRLLSPGTALGIAVDAYAGVPSEQWRDLQRLIRTRFPNVIWG